MRGATCEVELDFGGPGRGAGQAGCHSAARLDAKGRPPHIMIPHPALSQVRGEPRRGAEGPGCGAV